MRRFFATPARVITNWWHWYIDYLYVVVARGMDRLFKPALTRYRNGRSDKPAVVLLPGIYEQWQFMKPLADVIDSEGYPLHAVEALKRNTHSVEESALIVQQYIQASGMKKYIIVAHSKGGLVGKYLMLGPEGNHCLGMIALNAPFNGSLYARLFLVGPLKIFSPNSKIIRSLITQRNVNRKIVSIYGLFDPHIPGGSELVGAKNLQLPVRGHFKVIANHQVKQVVLNELARLARPA